MKRSRGFTLVELILVIVLVGIVGGILTMQMRPALQSYLSVTRRANLVNQADTALRRVVTDVRLSVPNSLRLQATPLGQCMEMVPTKDGGRYRMGPDIDQPDKSAVFDPTAPKLAFDVLTSLASTVGKGDMIVIGNENGTDLYEPVPRNVAAIADIAAGAAGIARHVITLAAGATMSGSYDGGRFSVIPGNGQVIGYLCRPAPPDAAGRSSGTLQRTVRDLGTPATQACTPTQPAQIVVTNVSDCSFVYRENDGATQQSGYLQLRLGLTDSGESASLTMGAHVENVP
jgi:MSHA biogenesis protein MshO